MRRCTRILQWGGVNSRWNMTSRRALLHAARSARTLDPTHNENNINGEDQNGKNPVERLPPSGSWREDPLYEDGVHSVTTAQRREIFARVVRIAAQEALNARSLSLLGLSASFVFCVGTWEGSLFIDYEQMGFFDAAYFSMHYGLEQILPSCIWGTKDAHLIARSLDLDPIIALRNFESGAEDAAIQLRAENLAATRSITAGFMLLAQVLRVVNISASASKKYATSIEEGSQPPLMGPRERIFRLCGIGSDATAVSLQRYGQQMFPIYEVPSKIRHLVNDHSHNGRVPVFWKVRRGFYGYRFSWKGFPIDSSSFIRSSTGRSILYIEADGTNPEDPLSLGEQALDLTIDDASQAFRQLEQMYRDKKDDVGVFRTLRVFLGNSRMTFYSGGGHPYTLRERILHTHEVDVLIDALAPVIEQLLRFCDRATAKQVGPRKSVLFQTSSSRYFSNLKDLLSPFGYDVHDPLDKEVMDGSLLARQRTKAVKSTQDDNNAEDDSENSREVVELPLILYFSSTSETINAAHTLVQAGEVSPASCCAIISKVEGLEHIRRSEDEKEAKLRRQRESSHATINVDVEKNDEAAAVRIEENRQQRGKTAQGQNRIHVVCSSIVYDDLFHQVRSWARMGYTAEDIQRELDGRYVDFFICKSDSDGK
eukprot:g2877.t1